MFGTRWTNPAAERANRHNGRRGYDPFRANWGFSETIENEVMSMTDKGFFIEALPHDGVVTFLALVKEKAVRGKRHGGFYLHLVLADRTGELDAKAWDNVQETAALFERDDIVKVRGTIELYDDRPQLIGSGSGDARRESSWKPTSARSLPGIPKRCFRSCRPLCNRWAMIIFGSCCSRSWTTRQLPWRSKLRQGPCGFIILAGAAFSPM